MDRVRLGRALGYGTRHAAKTLAAVAEAAAAPDPAPHGPRPSTSASTSATSMRTMRETAPPQVSTPRRPTAAQVRGASRSFWGPLATFSGALWLRVTGLFFALIALAMVNGAWRLRAVLLHNGLASAEQARHFWVFLAFAVLFGYFAATSFIRARLRERRAAAR